MKYKILEYRDFPNKLKKIKNPPQKLYYIGNEKILYKDCFGVVGSRKISEYGIKNCENFTRELVLRDIPIVSGMAIGTDSVAHKIAIEFGGETIAVLGGGFNNIYPKENLGLFNEIIENGGLVVTEYSPNEEALKENFPKRNRIITALSEGILVIEAAYRSGTSITVKNAKEQGKNVFALPGKLDSYLGIGVNNMIKKGAIFTTSIEDILRSYPQFKEKLRKTSIRKKKKCENIKKEYKEVLKLLQIEDLYIDEIMMKVNMNLNDVLILLTNMELEKIIIKENSGKYKIKESD